MAVSRGHQARFGQNAGGEVLVRSSVGMVGATDARLVYGCLHSEAHFPELVHLTFQFVLFRHESTVLLKIIKVR